MIGKPSSPVRREAARKRTSPGWYLAARPTHRAPRGALLYPRFSREGFGGRFLGRMADLDPKGEGDKSMPETRRPGPVVRDGALGGPA
jgi:hypothetical protein